MDIVASGSWPAQGYECGRVNNQIHRVKERDGAGVGGGCLVRCEDSKPIK